MNTQVMSLSQSGRRESSGFWLGIKDSISIGLASGLFGLVFGALAKSKGMSVALASVMSAGMYAGAAQMLTLNAWHLMAPHLITLLMIVLVVCMRYLLMGFVLRPHFEDYPKAKVYLSLFLLMDENWALTVLQAKKNATDRTLLLGYFVGAGLLSYLLWTVGTLFGGQIAARVPDLSALGVSFVFTAMFLGLLVSMWRGKMDVLPWAVALVVALVVYTVVPGNWYIIIGALSGSLVGALYEYFA